MPDCLAQLQFILFAPSAVIMTSSSRTETAQFHPNDLEPEWNAEKLNETRDQGLGQDQQVAHTFPEGGSKAWLVLLGCWCTSFATFGYVNSFGLVMIEIRPSRGN